MSKDSGYHISVQGKAIASITTCARDDGKLDVYFHPHAGAGQSQHLHAWVSGATHQVGVRVKDAVSSHLTGPQALLLGQPAAFLNVAIAQGQLVCRLEQPANGVSLSTATIAVGKTPTRGDVALEGPGRYAIAVVDLGSVSTVPAVVVPLDEHKCHRSREIPQVAIV